MNKVILNYGYFIFPEGVVFGSPNVVFGDLNACGGGERLSLVTMQALLKMGIDFDLTTFRKPDLSKLEKVYGNNLAMVMKNIVKTNVVDLLQVLQQSVDSIYDLTINTHGDVVPYYQSSFSKDNALTYCHFPTAKYFIETEDSSYLQRNLNITTYINSFRTEYSD